MRVINGERRNAAVRSEMLARKTDASNAHKAVPSLETYIAIAKPSASQTEAAVKLLAQAQLDTISATVGK